MRLFLSLGAFVDGFFWLALVSLSVSVTSSVAALLTILLSLFFSLALPFSLRVLGFWLAHGLRLLRVVFFHLNILSLAPGVIPVAVRRFRHSGTVYVGQS